MVSDARSVIHDALSGYWDPPAGNNVFDWDPDPDDMEYLSSDRRIDVLLGPILARFAIEQGAATDGTPTIIQMEGSCFFPSKTNPLLFHWHFQVTT